jgi:hypothetical protein
MLALLVTAGIVTATASVSETTSGPALIDVHERTFVALVPGPASADLRPGQTVRLDARALAGPPLTARVREAEVADQSDIRNAGFPASDQPAVLVTGVLASHADVGALLSSPRKDGRAVIVLRTETVLDLFLRQLDGTLGEEGDA